MQKNRQLTPLQIISLGYLLIIIIGTLILMMPQAAKSGQSAGFLTALFTAASSSCVTGLVVCDTASYWSVFGQSVILCLIQIGGLGFMTLTVTLFKIFRLKTGLRGKMIMAESINVSQIGGISALVKHIIAGTAIFEGAGALLLSFRFIPLFGLPRGIFYSVFHAVSSFCNAGFDLMGTYSGEYSSLTAFVSDPLVNITLMTLIVIGGIGFLVWEDILSNGLKIKKYRLHTKIVLLTTLILIVVPAVIFYLIEYNNTCRGMSFGSRLTASLFDSVTARTAGFNTTDTALLSDAGKFLTILLMFVGGSSGSTAGGVKTTTIAVVFLTFISAVKGKKETHCFGRKFSGDTLKKATVIIFTNICLAAIGTFIISISSGIGLTDAMFEAFSAVGTVGMTTGITRELNSLSKLAVIFLMYCGRVGSMSFATAVFFKRVNPPVDYPVEEVNIG